MKIKALTTWDWQPVTIIDFLYKDGTLYGIYYDQFGRIRDAAVHNLKVVTEED